MRKREVESEMDKNLRVYIHIYIKEEKFTKH